MIDLKLDTTPDGRILPDGSIAAGSNLLTSQIAPFTSQHVGKKMFVDGAYNNGVLAGEIVGVGVGGSVAELNVTANVSRTEKPFMFGTDNAPVINDALAAESGDTIQLGKGIEVPHSGRLSYICGPINVTHKSGTVLQGCGGAYSSTRILPAGENSIGVDFSGAAAVQLRNLTIGHRFNPCVLMVAVLHAPTPQVPGLDSVVHENVFVTGRYYKSALYNFGAGSSMASGSKYWNYAPADWLGERYAAVFSLDNSMAVQSPFVQLAVYGSANVWSFDACEFHECSGFSGTDYGAILWRGATDHTYTQCIVSGSSKLIVCKNPGVEPLGNPPRRHTFKGGRMENEQGSPIPSHVLNVLSDIDTVRFEGVMRAPQTAIYTGPGARTNCSWDGVPFQ